MKQCVCGIIIFLPIGEKVILIAGLVPLILIYSYSTGYFLPCLLIFLEEYDALLNAPFCCSFSWKSLDIIVLIIENERTNIISTKS